MTMRHHTAYSTSTSQRRATPHNHTRIQIMRSIQRSRISLSECTVNTGKLWAAARADGGRCHTCGGCWKEESGWSCVL